LAGAETLSSKGSISTQPVGGARHLPNLISGLRFPLAFVFAWGISSPDVWWRCIAFAAVWLALISDWADGFVARKYRTGSDFGKLLDPAADAFFFVVAHVALAWAGIIPWWLALPFVVREVVQHAYVRPSALRLGVTLGAKFVGKLKTTVQLIAVLLVSALEIVRGFDSWLVMQVRTDQLYLWFDGITWTAIGLSAALSIASIWPYLTHLQRLKRERREASPPVG